MAQINRLLLCSCEGSMSVDAETASKALGGVDVKTTTALCTTDLDIASTTLQADGTTLIACGQMSALFEELADEVGAGPRLATVDIRDRAGWTDDAEAHAKQAALLAEAVLPRPETPVREIVSEGTCLILGRADIILPAAERLADRRLERGRQHGTDLRLAVGREGVDDAADGTDGAVGMQGAEYEVAGLGGLNRNLDGFHIAHFADEHDVWILAQSRTQGA